MQSLPFLRSVRPMALILGVAYGLVFLPEAYASASFVQSVANAASGTGRSLSLSFPNNTVAGDLIMVGFDFATSATVTSVTDSQVNSFTQVGTQLTSPGEAVD